MVIVITQVASQDCQVAEIYDCSTNIPCTDANIVAGKFHFTHIDPHKFVQCSAFKVCAVRSCVSTLVFKSTIGVCTFGTTKDFAL